jgi:hypothetical protein
MRRISANETDVTVLRPRNGERRWAIVIPAWTPYSQLPTFHFPCYTLYVVCTMYHLHGDLTFIPSTLHCILSNRYRSSPDDDERLNFFRDGGESCSAQSSCVLWFDVSLEQSEGKLRDSKVANFLKSISGNLNSHSQLVISTTNNNQRSFKCWTCFNNVSGNISTFYRIF